MVSFALLLLLPAAAVIWLGVQLLRQDRDLELRQRRERHESAADRTVAGLEQAVTATERRLRGPASDVGIQPNDDAMVVRLRGDSIEPYPRARLLYYPAITSSPEPSPSIFETSEELEYRRSDFAAAAEACRRIAASSDDNDIRAGAFLRLARNLKRLGRHAEALRVYDDLSRLNHARIIGLPADLVARRAACVLLRDGGHVRDWRPRAEALLDDLRSARWVVDRGTFETYIHELEHWLARRDTVAAERLALADVAEWLWTERTSGTLAPAGRRAGHVRNVAVTTVWQSFDGHVVALIAGPGFQRRQWFGGLRPDAAAGFLTTLVDDGGRLLTGEAPSAAAMPVKRKAGETGLPWTVIVAGRDGAAMSDEFVRRRRLLLASLTLLLVICCAGGYAIIRAVSREFAVARLQTDFVAAVSHEFRTPLTSLHQFTALLNEEEEPPPAKRRAFYQAQARATERLRRLVESLLDFGRMEAGARPYRLQPLDACALVRSVAADFQKDVAAQGFIVDRAIPAGHVSVDADPEALGRALWNLLDNAAKYSGSSRSIAVSLRNGDGTVAIGVRDRGLGVPRQEQQEIFRKFVRGAASREHGIKGTGIGLAMVRHIVDAHGGRVRVDSAPGEGSTFTIELPQRRDSGAST